VLSADSMNKFGICKLFFLVNTWDGFVEFLRLDLETLIIGLKVI